MMAVRKKLLLGLVAIVLWATGFSQANNNAQSIFQQGVKVSHTDPQKAYRVFLKCMTLAKENGDWDVYIEALNKSSTLAIGDKGNIDGSFKSSREAIAFLEKFQSRNAVAELHYNVAEFYSLSSDVDTAVFYYEKAKDIWQRLNGEMNADVAKCYHGLGDVYKYNKLDFNDAEISYEKALSIRERIGFQDSLVLYKNFYSLAATNRSQRDYEKGLSYGAKAMDLAKALEPLKVEATTAMVANIYRDMKESEMAKKYYLEAIELNKKTKVRENRAWYYLCLGETFINDSSFREALNCYNQAYPFYKSSVGTDENLFFYLLVNMAEAYTATKEDVEFNKVKRELFDELSKRNVRRGMLVSMSLAILGDFHASKFRYDSALNYYQKALVSLHPAFTSLDIEDNPTYEMMGYFEHTYRLLIKKAAILREKFKATKDSHYLAKALSCLRATEMLVSRQRNTLDMEKSKWELLDSRYNLYEDIIARLMESEDVLPKDTLYALAFHYFEQSKSRSLADALAQAEQTKRISAQDSLFRIHTELRRQLLAVQDKINYELEESPSSKEITRLRGEMVGIDREIQKCKQAIEEKYPGYFNVKYGYARPGLADVQRFLKERGQVALEFLWGSEWVYAIGISGDKVMLTKIGRPDSLLVVISKLMHHFDEESSTTNSGNFEVFVSSAYSLFDQLVRPFNSLLNGQKRLLIIPDGPVSQVPFEVLLREPNTTKGINYRSLQYLIKTYSIGYSYSSVMLMRRNDRLIKSPNLLAVGFTGGARLRAPDPELEEIIGAEEELEALEKRFKKGKFLVGPEATEANFKALSPQYDIIHLAIHGRGDVQRSFSSSLYFRSRFDSLDDGELHDYELYGLKLKALMAVLSACESGLGREYKGEGMISMASAFTYSGCANILMSLWKVNDKASTVLMDDFYGHLLEGITIDDALRQAKLDYLDRSDEFTADPKVWAPLVAYGNLQQIFRERNGQLISFGAIALAISILIFYVIRRKTT